MPLRASESLTARLVDALERAADALMCSGDCDLAIECWALALRIRYVTSREEGAL